MKEKDNQVQSVLSKFQEQGWVDLDEILELLTKNTPKSSLSLADKTEKDDSDQDILHRKIAALMDLADLTDAQREQLIAKCKTVEQLRQLHNEWEGKINAILGNNPGESEIPSQEDLYTNYSNYQSGNKERMRLI